MLPAAALLARLFLGRGGLLGLRLSFRRILYFIQRIRSVIRYIRPSLWLRGRLFGHRLGLRLGCGLFGHGLFGHGLGLRLGCGLLGHGLFGHSLGLHLGCGLLSHRLLFDRRLSLGLLGLS